MIHKLVAAVLALCLAAPCVVFAATPVNVNHADAATIAKSLDGIGQSRAEAIVAWREAHGPFKKADDLHHVKGIGKATIERNRSAILLADAETASDDGVNAEAASADVPAKPARKPRKAAGSKP